MLTIDLKHGSLIEQMTGLLVVHLFKGVTQPSGAIGEVNRMLDGLLFDYIKQEGFEGKEGEWLVFPTFGKAKAKKIAVMGLGERESFTLDTVRKVGAHIIRRAREAKAKSVCTVLLGAGVAKLPVREAAEALAEGMWLGAYHFHTYKGKDAPDATKKDVVSVTLVEAERAKVGLAERGVSEAKTLAEATMLARDLVNTPSMDMAPKHLAEIATSVASKSKRISVKLLDEATMRKMGMDATLAVAKGSEHKAAGVHLIYKPTKKAKKRIVVVGKAVTFDSGGLSIKPADGMMTMKIDMAGAASVIGLFHALPSLDLDVEVHGIFLAVENMPSGSAYRPGDVVRAMNGKTIEVLNTDAEGRVTLADALSYASELKPDAIVDLATLTGACVVALGEDVSGILSNDRKLCDRLLVASKQAGEALWELPLYQPYQELIKSKVADIKNIGGRSGGTITAALFLSHFVAKDIPWAHLDIAGPSYAEKETRPDMPFGGTGAGVRLLARYLQGL